MTNFDNKLKSFVGRSSTSNSSNPLAESRDIITNPTKTIENIGLSINFYHFC
jgi:hypothetical protein